MIEKWIFKEDNSDPYFYVESKRKFRYLKVIKKNFLNSYEKFLLSKVLSGSELTATEKSRFKKIMRMVNDWFNFLDKYNYKNVFEILEKELYKRYFVGKIKKSKIDLKKETMIKIAEISRLDGNKNVYMDILREWIVYKKLKETSRKVNYSESYVEYIIGNIIDFLLHHSLEDMRKFGELLLSLKKNSNYSLSLKEKELREKEDKG